MSESPGAGSGMVALLFTDVVRSTELLQRLGDDAAEDLRRAHFALLRQAVSKAGGQEVKSLGDGLMVTFPSALQAVGCAVAMQRAIAGHNLADPGRALQIRIGLHLGEPAADEDDFFGTSVVAAKRLCDRAEGNEILASALVAAMVGSRGGFRLRSVGPLELKGLAEPLPAVSVEWRLEPTDTPGPAASLVGRDQLLNRLGGLVGRALAGQRVTVMVTGEAGVGKTSLLRAVAAVAGGQGARIGWGTCLDVEGAPGYWPWTQALDGLVRAIGSDEARRLAGDDAPLLATIVPALGDPAPGELTDRARLLLFDAASRLLDSLASDRGLVVVLDDLHWADASSLALFDFVARAADRSGVCLIGAYRHNELDASARALLGALVSHSEHVHVEGIDADATQELVARLTGRTVDRATADAIHRRTGGHPFFVREIALHADHADGNVDHIPAAVRDVIERRMARLPDPTRALLEVAAIMGTGLRPDVAARALDTSPLAVEVAARDAVVAGVLTPTGDGLRFAHDLLRETILDRLEAPHRVALHRAIGTALEERAARTAPVAPAELARHFIAAIPLNGPERAVRWALRAATADCEALAFAEAAAHLRRLRAALAEAAVDLADDALFDILVAEADALARAGSTLDARGLLRAARDLADRTGDPDRTASVALATAELGARFAVRRDEIVRDLDRALTVVAGTNPAREAQLTATLARELQHSVAEERPRAGPLSERALDLGRRAGDPATLAACLLARHDVLWTAGTELERADIAREIIAVALDAGDDERHAQGLLLLANALLEHGSPAFEAALDGCLVIFDRLGQPLHRYLAETRRACLALLTGRLDEADERIEHAAGLGDRIREPDTGNVRMSQRLELVRARGRPDELEAFAADAVAHWTGAPIHAHAVAAGFSARAGDLEAARHHVAAVVDLGTWRADRSYLWSVFVRELAQAAVALGDRDLCAQLLDDLAPLAGSCGVNGAVVAFAGSHAHTAGLLAAALDQPDRSRQLLEEASDTYQRLGATGWYTEARRDLGVLDSAAEVPATTGSMHRRGGVWHISFAGATAVVPHTKGLGDIARLLAVPGTEIHVLDLMDAADRSGGAGSLADRRSLDAYRKRLADLETEQAEAASYHDDERSARLEVERQALLEELGRLRGAQGRIRQFANHPAERARKAVAARVRDAIGKLEPHLAPLAAHLQRTIVTGTYCRYRPEGGITWDVDGTPDDRRTLATS
ncbi:MAG TPA: AAA family ATPase [Acidimicrobiia bacterium]|nr:AAA family ATPase [Acidimicrobiia bacterium]